MIVMVDTHYIPDVPKQYVNSRSICGCVSHLASIQLTPDIPAAAKDSVPVKGSGPTEEPPRVSSHLQSKVVSDGEAVTLACRVTGE